MNAYKTIIFKQTFITIQNTTKEYFHQLKHYQIGNTQQISNQLTISNSKLK